MHYHLPSEISARSASGIFRRKDDVNLKEEYGLDIREVKDTQGNIIHHTLQLGALPRTKINEEQSKILEKLYHGGNLQEGLVATGRWYTENGQKEYKRDFAGKHSPEFEYNGELYVRQVAIPNEENLTYSDGTVTGKIGTIKWEKVEPISFVIKNWDEMPKAINPKGNGNAKYFDLRAEEAIIGNIPFYPDEDDLNSTMWQNSMPRGFLNGIDVRNITQNGNSEFGAARGGDFSDGCNFLEEAFNLAREPIHEYVIPESQTEIPDDAFNGCVALKKVVMHSGITSIGKRAFDGIRFKYAYRLKTGELVFGQELPEKQEEYENAVELGNLARPFVGFDYNILVQNDKLEQITQLSEKLNKNKFKVPYIYAEQLADNGKIDALCENADFRFLRSELPKINEQLLEHPQEERLDFFKFAEALGCFSNEKVLDKNGKETNVVLAQKASSLLASLLKTDGLKLGNYHGLFDSLPIGTKPDQAFFTFISQKGGKAKFENLDLLMELETNHPGMFIKVMTNFEEAKSYRETLNEEGKPITVPWEEALKKFYLSNKYIGVTKENSDIAELFGGKGLSQEIFEKANRLRQKAVAQKVPEHLLEKSVKEETILESIERIKKQTEEELTGSKQLIEELYDKQFTYEWLSKNDPHNSIMGLFCSCCGSITSSAYGKDIAKASVQAPDVQNLVIRNSKGEIISKGTMYLNQKDGYGVINDFELNKRYRNHESGSGRYNVDIDSLEEQERDLVFKAFQRGIMAFVEEFDSQNPKKPLKQINVGMGYNRLKRQVEQFKKASVNLTVPTEYQFQDAMTNDQYILYEKKAEEKQIKNGGIDR